jgi:predicted AlkP superfamily pyrophosphatase or phosphodiesterase
VRFLASIRRLPYDLIMRFFCARSLALGALLVGSAVAGEPPPAPPGAPPGAPPLPAVAATAKDPARATRVLIISEDGLRPDVLASMRLPWHEALYKSGAYSWKARTIRTASTLPSHAAMLSGVDVNQHGLSWNNWRPRRGFIRVPTIFGEAEEHGMKTAMFVGKFKLRHIAAPGTVGLFDRPGYLCKKVSEEAAEYLVQNKTPLAFVHFSDPDEAGHSAGWDSPKYHDALAATDRCLGTIMEALDKAGMTDQTLIIISADHGGHNHTHSGALLVDREIPWIAHGPGVRAGYRIRGPISTVDTAATALYALGLPVSSTLAGKPVKEIFSQP